MWIFYTAHYRLDRVQRAFPSLLEAMRPQDRLIVLHCGDRTGPSQDLWPDPAPTDSESVFRYLMGFREHISMFVSIDYNIGDGGMLRLMQHLCQVHSPQYGLYSPELVVKVEDDALLTPGALQWGEDLFRKYRDRGVAVLSGCHCGFDGYVQPLEELEPGVVRVTNTTGILVFFDYAFLVKEQIGSAWLGSDLAFCNAAHARGHEVLCAKGLAEHLGADFGLHSPGSPLNIRNRQGKPR